MKKIQMLIIVVVAVAVLSTAVFATAAWFKLFTSTYSPKAGTDLAKAKCATCHIKGTTKLNPYGMQFKGKPMTAATLKAVEKMDADKDKASNIAEIKAGTLPGDPTSKPAGKPAPKPAKPKAKK